MSTNYTEADYENSVIELLRNDLGYEYVYGPDVERDFHSPLYEEVLEDALYRLNKDLPSDAIQDAIFKLKNFENGELVQKNAVFMDYLQNGIPVRFFVNGEERSSIVYLADYKNPDNNSFIVANQWTFIENSNKRADIILFLNGLPVVLVELKSPSREETDASEAYRQLRNYMLEIPSMFIYNAICVMSDQLTSKAGTITSGEDRFMEWKTKDGNYENTQFAQFDTFFEGMFQKERLLDIIKNFICFSNEGISSFKILAGYHQYFAVRKAIVSTQKATVTDGNNRENLLTGKAMIVAYSRPIAMKIYKRILELRPSWKEKVGVVMTSGNNDPEEWREIIGNKQHKDELAKKFKDNNSPMKIAIVVDMWLTGFDVPSLATMYVYKPMAGHNLMQAIARVNRVFRDKEGGLVVDYVGIASALKRAMNDYTTRDKKNYGDTDVAKVAYPKFLEKLSICKDLFHEYDYSKFTTGSDLERAKTISGAVNFIIARDKEEEKTAFIKESLMLHQALSLCSSLVDEEMRFEAAFFESVRVLVGRWMNAGTDKKISLPEMNARINELLKQSIKSDGVINLFSDIKEEFSLFDPKFLEEIAKMKEKNLAVELLKKLIAEQVHIYKRTNVVKSEKFSEIIHEAMNRYLNGMLTNEQVIEELLNLAKQIAAAQKEGEQLGLTADELAFYDALTKPQAIKDFYENEELIAITKELAETLRKNKTIDWQKRESARAKMRMLIKKLLKKHKYPPEGMEDAVQTVMTQCELWTDNNDMSDEKVINFRCESTSYVDSDYADSMMVAESATTYGTRK